MNPWWIWDTEIKYWHFENLSFKRKKILKWKELNLKIKIFHEKNVIWKLMHDSLNNPKFNRIRTSDKEREVDLTFLR